MPLEINLGESPLEINLFVKSQRAALVYTL